MPKKTVNVPEILEAIRVCLKDKVKCSYHSKKGPGHPYQYLSIISRFIRLHIIAHKQGVIINKKTYKNGGYYIDFSNPKSDPQKLIDLLLKIPPIEDGVARLLTTSEWSKYEGED